MMYPILALLAIVASVLVWSYLLQHPSWRDGADRRLPLVYVSALVGAVLGAKLVYLAAEGWIYLPALGQEAATDDWWRRWWIGKSILGALLGGYLAVEAAKRLLGYTRVTGDLFAVIVPAALVFGRIGCLLHGCCPGVESTSAWYTLQDQLGIERWPAVPVELAFNALFLIVALVVWRRGQLTGQLFHVYLIAYGIFRFAHEFLRDTPRVLGPLSGYHLAALALLLVGALRYAQRQGRGISNIEPTTLRFSKTRRE